MLRTQAKTIEAREEAAAKDGACAPEPQAWREYVQCTFNDGEQVKNEMADAFMQATRCVMDVEPLALAMAQRATARDFSAEVRGNGLRSFLRVVERVLQELSDCATACIANRDGLLFNWRAVHTQVTEWACVILERSIRPLLVLTIEVADQTDPVTQFLDADKCESIVAAAQEGVDTTVFFGKHLGFQFDPGLRQIHIAIGAHLPCPSPAPPPAVRVFGFFFPGALLAARDN